MRKIFACILILLATQAWGQKPGNLFDSVEDDINVGGDIFNDFNEDLEASQVVEDERFYRYGRFFSFNLGLGMTRFTGNRGRAYQTNLDPSFNMSLAYFFNFQSAFTLGFQYSKHAMFFGDVLNGYRNQEIGTVEVTMLRPFFGFRYYMDTANYGNAVTYSNPYFILRLEYWYQTNKFPDVKTLEKQTGGGLGTALGIGLEFPVELKKSYVGVEFLWHWVSFFDKFTQDYRACDSSGCQTDPSVTTYDDLTGNAYDIFITYNITW